MPVGSRPPWVKISQLAVRRLPETRLASMATTMHWLPNLSAASRDEFGPLHRGGVDRDLVGAGNEQVADILDRPHAAADGQRHEAVFGGFGDHIKDDAAIVRRGGDVEEASVRRRPAAS